MREAGRVVRARMKASSKLRSVADGLWSIDGEVWDKGVHSRLRTPVVQLADGGLWLYSPGPLHEEVIDQLGELGEVAHLVAPNLNHHKFLRAASERYPAAQVWGPPGLELKVTGLPLEPLEARPEFGETLHGVRLGGVPFTQEVVFHHPSSGSLICADFVHNIQGEAAFFTRQLWRAIGAYKTFGQNRYWRARTEDHAAFAASTDIVESWGAPRVLMSHGDILEEGGAAALRQALHWVRR